MLKEVVCFVQEPLEGLIPSFSDKSKEALKLECEALEATLEKRNVVSLEATLAGVTLDESEAYEALRCFADPVEIEAITADVNRLFSVSLAGWSYRVDRHATPPCLSLKAKGTREHRVKLRELSACWFGARAGNAARSGQPFLWPSWLCDRYYQGMAIFDWPLLLPCPCCGTARAGVFSGPVLSRPYDDAEKHYAQMQPCQQCGHVDTIGCACNVCAPDYARLLDHFADHVRILPSLYRAIVGIGEEREVALYRALAISTFESLVQKHNTYISDARMRFDFQTCKGYLPPSVRTLLAKARWSDSEVNQAIADYCDTRQSDLLDADTDIADNSRLAYKKVTVSLKAPFELMPMSFSDNDSDTLEFPDEIAASLDNNLPKPLQWLALLPTLPLEQRISVLIPMLARAENPRRYDSCLNAVRAFYDFGIGVCVSEDIVVNPYYLNADESMSSDGGTLAVSGR